MKDQEWENFKSEISGSGYLCPICYENFNTREEKSKHLDKIHGYEVLCNERLKTEGDEKK